MLKKNSCISESYFFLLSAYRKKNYSKKKSLISIHINAKVSVLKQEKMKNK